MYLINIHVVNYEFFTLDGIILKTFSPLKANLISIKSSNN